MLLINFLNTGFTMCRYYINKRISLIYMDFHLICIGSVIILIYEIKGAEGLPYCLY